MINVHYCARSIQYSIGISDYFADNLNSAGTILTEIYPLVTHDPNMSKSLGGTDLGNKNCLFQKGNSQIFARNSLH